MSDGLRRSVTQPQAREPGRGIRGGGGEIWFTAHGIGPAAGSSRGKDAA